MGYEVLAEEYTAHRDVRVLKNKEGEVTGRQLGLGKTYYKGEVIPDDALGQVYKDILEDEDAESHEYLKARLKKVDAKSSEDAAKRLGLPFEGYDDMDEDEVVAAMRHLPSGLIQRIKQYEEEHGEGRPKITGYIIGFGTDPDARQEGRVGAEPVSDEDHDAEGKATAKLTTRSVPGVDDDAPDEGIVQHGEGFTGTGEGAKPYGKDKAEDKGDDDDEKPKRNVRSRRGRRDRQVGTTPGEVEGAGDPAAGSTNE